MEARTASPRSPFPNTICRLLYTSEAIQRKGTNSLSKSPSQAAVARANSSTNTKFIWMGLTILVGNCGLTFKESLKSKRILKNSGVGILFLK